MKSTVFQPNVVRPLEQPSDAKEELMVSGIAVGVGRTTKGSAAAPPQLPNRASTR